LKNQKDKKYIASKGEMDPEVPNHEPDNRNVAVVNSGVGELKAPAEHEPKKAEGGRRGLLQISDTLANTREVFLDGNGAPKMHNLTGQEEPIDTHCAQCQKRQLFQQR
jgi:hypothetical protein